MRLFIACDIDGSLTLWTYMPRRCREKDVWVSQMSGSFLGKITTESVEMCWDDEPIEVDMSINGESIYIDSISRDNKIIITR